jgi:dTDP-4-dehydrorhamnose 3,5-epimerase
VVFSDERGRFFETFEKERYAEFENSASFVQDNYSSSLENVLRGLHYQFRQPQAQLVSVLRGSVFDVIVDVRVGSPTFGQWFGATLEQGDQIYMPAGVAHGFLVVSSAADLHYRVSEPYRPENEAGIRWDDPDLDVAWPRRKVIISDRDAKFPLWSDVPPERLPVFGG